MENHPIPQDVTGFQFRLIGDMTVKQFAYLAAGVVMAWVFFSLPIHFLIKSPFVLLCASLGASLAFVPIEGRPMDLMLMNFLKALTSPNQFVYQKMGGKLFPERHVETQTSKQKPQRSSEKLESLLSSIQKEPKNKLDEKELAFFKSLPLPGVSSRQTPQQPPHSTSQPQIIPQTPIHADTPPSSEKKSFDKDIKSSLEPKDTTPQIISAHEIQKSSAAQVPQASSSEHIIRQEKMLEHEKETIKKPLATVQKPTQLSSTPSPTHSTITPEAVEILQKQLDDMLSQKAHLEKQLAELVAKLQPKPTTPIFAPKTIQQPITQVKKDASHIHQIPKNMASKLGIPFTPDVPNLIAGIVKDARGNILPNILIEVKDKEDNAVRAFKTNSLGQFASATPLVNGTYTISFEDPQGNHDFETIDLTANGMLIPSLEIISIDAREELRRSLFGS